MIGVIASIMGGLILREYIMLIAPAVFIISLKNRDAGLIAYFLYIIYSSSKVVSGDVYAYGELINALIFAFSGILLLDDVLRREIRINKLEIIPILIILLGLLIPEGFLAAGLLYFLMMKPSLRVGVPVFGVMLVFIMFKNSLSGLGPSGQTVVFGSFALFTLAVAFLTRDVKKVEMLR
ncbi:hypothetical protein E3E22_04435 [Thermococcus sp. MV5]|uniref:hypothetical protein n=1 Tax=Thermococcus sp. MV5 TaxID=1638272 RepID=UPI00143B795B|nr:hypothetical protein [Thermococcus sp. MV5]NJE25878.1 hypothetical protein [Thermococcus sp. MV5]